MTIKVFKKMKWKMEGKGLEIGDKLKLHTVVPESSKQEPSQELEIIDITYEDGNMFIHFLKGVWWKG